MGAGHETEDGTICYCPATGVIETLSNRYAMPIVCAVGAHGTIRFGDLEDHLPAASSSTLSVRLDELEAAGLVDRRSYDEVPPRVEYALTDEGEELQERLRPLVAWATSRDADDGRGEGRGPSERPGSPGNR